MNGVVIAGTASGVGKTIATLAVIRALHATGRTVQPAKAGPDFIDPSHHTAITDTPSRTLDLWLEGTDGIRRNYYNGDGDICVIEGVMGLYDGDKSSTAMVADALDLPVILVVDAAAGRESVAATALGFHAYTNHTDHDIDIAGIIAARAHGGRHERGITDALPPDLTSFGRVPPRDDLDIPERHLGLHMADEAPVPRDALDAAATHIDADRIAAIARPPPRPPPDADTPSTDSIVAMAQDAAFQFYYPATIERFRHHAQLSTFSPLDGDPLPVCDAVYLPGGYPELHATTLTDSPTLGAIRERAMDGLPVFAECGGMMTLAETLTPTGASTVDMAGVLPADVRMHDRYQALDHVELEATTPTLTAPAGARLRGHEFHYSSADVATDARFAFTMHRGVGIDGDHDGLIEHNTLGTYCHVHAESGAFDHFITNL